MRDDALVASVALVVLLVPLGTNCVQALLLIRQHHRVHRLNKIEKKWFILYKTRNKPKNKHGTSSM